VARRRTQGEARGGHAAPDEKFSVGPPCSRGSVIKANRATGGGCERARIGRDEAK